MIYVPARIYDSIQASVVMTTVAKPGAIDLIWSLNEAQQALDPVVYRVSANSERTELEKNPDGSYSDVESGLQQARSTAEVSLWQ
jgi:hypothetical protein